MAQRQEKLLKRLAEELRKEVIESPTTPSVERCQDLVQAVADAADKNMSIALLANTQIGVILGKSSRAFKRHKRTERSEEPAWTSLVNASQGMIAKWKLLAKAEEKEQKTKKQVNKQSQGLPASVQEYKERLTQHKKQLYKNPPCMPPQKVVTDMNNYGLPKRNKNTGLLTFAGGDDDKLAVLLKDFHPNRTPEDVLRAGAFGGTYFRAIVSGVTNVHYKPAEVLKDTLEPDWIEGLDKKTFLTSAKYRPEVNKFGVKCGGSLGMWESSGWIGDSDPSGGFNGTADSIEEEDVLMMPDKFHGGWE
eukprot:CAMPEP_0194038782 /NCGR_PEP_ID=MMETSP0009_2-20130614/11000_1 /TAXON_ID=210454 /ORGANISM="Grammatophora oceanica, Strain CCMP 410" /LENGTH=304 /DNA_ID=CAMNT_0038681405 /DNA_START=3 /DNA_END=918 /DNA_ORIENTATION=+